VRPQERPRRPAAASRRGPAAFVERLGDLAIAAAARLERKNLGREFQGERVGAAALQGVGFRPAAVSLNLGPFKPRQSGNPGGRSKAQIDVRNAARAYTQEAIDTLILVMRNGKPGETAMAANSLLDRGWGKPNYAEPVESDSASRVMGIPPECRLESPQGGGKRDPDRGGHPLPLVRASLSAPPGWFATGVLHVTLPAAIPFGCAPLGRACGRRRHAERSDFASALRVLP
jgi:hypothetical protein